MFCLLPLFFTQGAWCVPASCRECQQDVFCHHRPVEDQQHVSLQPRLFPAPLPEGSTDQEGDQAPQNSHTASVFLQRASSWSYETWIQNSTPHSCKQTVINCLVNRQPFLPRFSLKGQKFHIKKMSVSSESITLSILFLTFLYTYILEEGFMTLWWGGGQTCWVSAVCLATVQTQWNTSQHIPQNVNPFL